MSMRSYVGLGHRLLGEASVASLAETFRALGDTTRVRILDALSRAELCVQDLADLLGLTQSAVSHQLRLLRAMRLVRTRRDGRLVFYALDDDHIVKLFEQGLEHVEERTSAATARLKARAPVQKIEREAAAERPIRARHKVPHP
jgi:ArsR family transcriptional regulator